MVKDRKRNGYQIDYYSVEGFPGGSQAWCKDSRMQRGGCGPLAAGDMLICLAGNYGLKDCCPYDSDKLTKDSYSDFASLLKTYIRPRPYGVIRLSVFIKGLKKYLKDRGYEAQFDTCPGKTEVREAEHFIEEALRRNLPIACLILWHKDPDMKSLRWHWFSITGCRRRGDTFYIQVHTYGRRREVPFEPLWNTGHMIKGGMVSLSSIRRADP